MSGAICQVTIRGRVQGVGYRAWVEHEATRRDLEGWVRNRRDGSVEALFAGPEEVVSAMIESCRRGPSSARVEAVQEEAATSDALNLRRAGERFSVLQTI
ncbi:acylphosphatase [Bradyrhizobium sp. AZCC 2289]|uniref:acylphosphatase n=1 Tax=Bradyrhizobium sp. AZCC 2289 TaxID=3117026 RepID=UPI002FF2F0AB